MVYLRPNAAEFDTWRAVGNDDWSWGALLPYFRKSEHLQVPPTSQQAQGATFIPDAHGFDGPLDIGWSPTLDIGRFGRALNASWETLGLRWNVDPNAGSLSGLFLHPSEFNLALGGGREDAARAYYWPVADRSNLHTFSNAIASRVLLSNASPNGSKVATGVEVVMGNESRVISAKREVLLSAGSYRTPGLLEMSGIGNPRWFHVSEYPVLERTDMESTVSWKNCQCL